MEKFKRVINEINENINNVILFNVVTKATLFFLIIFFILTLFNFYPLFALIPGLMYFVVLIYVNFMRSKARVIGTKYPELFEKLLTAMDYKNVDNPVVNELHEEVKNDMRGVRVSSFINKKQTYRRVGLIVLLSFAVMILSYLDVTILDIGTNFQAMKDTPNTLTDFSSEEFFQDIFGEGSDLDYGSDELKVEIRPIGFEVNVRQLTDIPEETFGENSFPQEVFVTSSESFKEDFSKEHAELVKDYFERISKI